MDDQPRFTVRLTRAVDEEAIAAAAPLIAAATGTDAEKVEALLRRGPSNLTKGLPRDEAAAVARIFTEAGVEVAVAPHQRSSHATDGAAAPPPPQPAGAEPPAAAPRYGRPTAAPSHRGAGPGTRAQPPSRSATGVPRVYLWIGVAAVAVLAFAAGRLVGPAPSATPSPAAPLESAAEPTSTATTPSSTTAAATQAAAAIDPVGPRVAEAPTRATGPEATVDADAASQPPQPPPPPPPAPAPTRSVTPAAIHPDDAGVFRHVPIEQFVGARFVFLERPTSLQHFDYQLVRRTRERQYSGDYRVSYQEAVGRVGRVVAVEKDVIIHLVQLEMEDDGQTYFVEAYLNSMSDLGPVADIEHAKRLYQGATLWLSRRIPFTYDDEAGSFGTVDARPFSPVRVVDVVPGWYDHTPVRFVLETPSGERGLIDVNMSGTNVGEILFAGSRFDDYFFVQDPRVLYRWSDRVWAAIEDERVFIGMTADQARLAWGKPTSVNRTTTRSGTREQWVYRGGNYLYFQDGVLETIQN